MSAKTLLALLAAGTLAACSARPEPVATMNSLEAYASASGTLTMAVAAPRPAGPARTAAGLARLPGGFAPVRQVEEWSEGPARVQEIALGGRLDRDSHLRLAVGRGPAVARPTEAMIRAEIASAFPGEAARVVGTPRHNAFGPYGLAVVSGPGERRCVYAWQWLAGTDSRIRQRLGGGDAVWRLRLCRDGITLDDIAAALDRLDLGAVRPAPAQPRRTARATRRDAPAPVPRLPVETGSVGAVPGAGRYLAPIAAPEPAIQTTVSSARLATTLPAEAYRGPAFRAAAGSAASRSPVPVPAP